MSDFEQEWQPSARDKRLHELATRYHTECEAYDRTVCTGPIRHGEIMPASGQELSLVNGNAHRVRRQLLTDCRQDGISAEELYAAIAKWTPTSGGKRV